MLKHILALLVIAGASLAFFWYSPDNPLQLTAAEDYPPPTSQATPSPEVYDAWLTYRGQLYVNARITEAEIQKLNSTAKTLADQHAGYEEKARRVGKYFPKIGNALAETARKNLPIALAKENKLILGNSRYEYVIKAKKQFFDSYNQRTGGDTYIAEW